MLWYITNDVLHEQSGKIVATFFPGMEPIYQRFIRTPEIISLVFEFKEFFDAKKRSQKNYMTDFMTNKSTRAGNYNVTGKTRISTYYI